MAFKFVAPIRTSLVSRGDKVRNNIYADIRALATQIIPEVLSVTATTYTLGGAGNLVVLLDASANAVTLTLPSVASSLGKKWIFKCIDATNVVTVAAAGTDTIEGAATINLILWQVVTLYCTGTEWVVIGN